MAGTFNTRNHAQRLVVSNLLDKICCWNHHWTVPYRVLPTWEEVSCILDYRGVNHNWKDEVECGVEFHALRLAMEDLSVQNGQLWVPAEEFVLIKFHANCEAFMHSRTLVNPVDPRLVSLPLRALSLQELVTLRDALASSTHAGVVSPVGQVYTAPPTRS